MGSARIHDTTILAVCPAREYPLPGGVRYPGYTCLSSPTKSWGTRGPAAQS
jgi:hypothetical protein